VLVFCGTRDRVEKAALDLKALSQAGLLHVAERSTGLSGSSAPPERARFLADLPRNVPDKLRECLEHGIGYHHASALFVPAQQHPETCSCHLRQLSSLFDPCVHSTCTITGLFVFCSCLA
jgi:hypothetical protein